MTPRGKRLIQGLAMVLFGVVILGLVTYSSISHLGKIRLAEATLQWNDTFGTWEELLDRHPSRETSASALALEQLAVRVGADLAPRMRETAERPSRESGRAFGEAVSELGDYLDAELRAPAAAVGPPPENGAGFLEAQAPGIAELREALLSGQRPDWELRIEETYRAPIPNSIVLLKLNNAARRCPATDAARASGRSGGQPARFVEAEREPA